MQTDKILPDSMGDGFRPVPFFLWENKNDCTKPCYRVSCSRFIFALRGTSREVICAPPGRAIGDEKPCQRKAAPYPLLYCSQHPFTPVGTSHRNGSKQEVCKPVRNLIISGSFILLWVLKPTVTHRAGCETVSRGLICPFLFPWADSDRSRDPM